MRKKFIFCVLTASVLLFTACQKQNRDGGAADETVDTTGYSEASTLSALRATGARSGANGRMKIGNKRICFILDLNSALPK